MAQKGTHHTRTWHVIWHGEYWLAAECQICHGKKLLIDALLEVIKAQVRRMECSFLSKFPKAMLSRGDPCDPSGSSSEMLSLWCDIQVCQ